MRYDAVVRHCVDHGTCGARITFLGRYVLGPVAIVSWKPNWHELARLIFRKDKVEHKKRDIPCEEDNESDELAELLLKTHDVFELGRWLDVSANGFSSN